MRSTIYVADKIENKVHEFGEAAEPRYWAMLILPDGTETPVALTPKQVDVGVERASRELPDRMAFEQAYLQHRWRARAALAGALALAVLVGLGLGQL